MTSSSRLSKTFTRLRASGRPAFVAYIAAGDPDYERGLVVADELVAGGVDILELGIPFSDPLADGEANQLASQRALASGMTQARSIELAAEVRRRHPELPVVLYTYLNPVAFSMPFERFCGDAARGGVDALLLLDLSPEEGPEFKTVAERAGLSLVGLVAPTTPEDRIPLIARHASAFIYYICREGVTGERSDFAGDVRERIEAIRRHTSLPVAVGFGISKPEHVRMVAAAGADGVVVGSAIVRRVESFAKGASGPGVIRDFVRQLSDGRN